MKRLEVEARLESLEAVRNFVNRDLRRLEPSVVMAQDIELVLEEIFTNIVFHGYRGREGKARITCFQSSQRSYGIEFVDSGIPFNPLTFQEPDFDRDFADRDIGGLGIHLVRKLVHDMQYKREDPYNVLTVIFRIE